MSFRSRLTTFFILIVVVPMIAIGFVVFRLIGQSASLKADARATGLANATATLYDSESRRASAEAKAIVSSVDLTPARDPAGAPALRRRLARIAESSGLVRILVSDGSHILIRLGDERAVAPGSATAQTPNGRMGPTVTVSETTAGDLVDQLASPTVDVVVRNGRHTLAASSNRVASLTLPPRALLSVAGTQYREITQTFAGFGRARIAVSVLSDLQTTESSLSATRLIAAVLIAGFLLLAFGFSVMASRQLSSQVSRFLAAARRLGGGDFSAPIPIDGGDEFAQLGREFNRMSEQLEQRLEELRMAVRRTGQTFAANLDRGALLGLSLQTTLDGVLADAGRITSREHEAEPLTEINRVGPLTDHEDAIVAAERSALSQGPGGVGEVSSGGCHVAAVALGPIDLGPRLHGVIAVLRVGRPFDDDDRDVLRSLAAQTTLALENIRLHHQVRRQAVTDELTGLVNHRRFQELLADEMEQVRRYHHPVGLIMLDIDNFKLVNDTYGHPQGDLVLNAVARVLRDTSRDADTAARYGGEEMALVLPHTGLEGAYAIAERIRSAIESLTVPRIGGDGVLRVTASLGVAATTDGTKEELIVESDRALYEAKNNGKNRTARASAAIADARSGQ